MEQKEQINFGGEKTALVKEMVSSDNLRTWYRQEIVDDLQKKLEKEGRGGDISMSEGLSFLDGLEKEARVITKRKEEIIGAYGPLLGQMDDIVLTRRLCAEIVRELCGRDAPVGVEYSDSEDDPYFSPETMTIFIPRVAPAMGDKRPLVKKLVHEIGHFKDFQALPDDKDRLVDFLRPANVASFHKIFEGDREQAARRVRSFLPPKEKESSDEWQERFKKYCADENALDTGARKDCSDYISVSIVSLHGFIKYANDPFELAADRFALEKSSQITREKIAGMAEVERARVRSSCKVEGFAEGSPISGIQKELSALMPDRVEFLWARLKNDVAARVDDTPDFYARETERVLKKAPIFDDLISKIYDSYDQGLCDVDFAEDDWQRLADWFAKREKLEPVRVKIVDEGDTSCFKFWDNTIYMPKNVALGADRRLAMRQFTHELKHATDLQKLDGKKNIARYLDSAVYGIWKNMLSGKMASGESGTADKMLFEKLNLMYRQDYYEMQAEKFSLAASKIFTKAKVEEILS